MLGKCSWDAWLRPWGDPYYYLHYSPANLCRISPAHTECCANSLSLLRDWEDFPGNIKDIINFFCYHELEVGLSGGITLPFHPCPALPHAYTHARRILTLASLSSTPPNPSQLSSHTSLFTLPEAATQLHWQVTQGNTAQPRHALLHFYSVHFHISHNTEKASKRNSNQLFHCTHISSLPQFKILFSNTVIKILCINRKCKKIRKENTFSLS